MQFPLNKAGVEKHLLIAILSWMVILVFVAWFLPPTDSHRQLQPLAKWSIVAVAGLPAIYIAMLVPVYFYQSWKMLPTVPNKISYGLWLGFETIAFLAILALFWFSLVHSG
jgi:hypothetical protein